MKFCHITWAHVMKGSLHNSGLQPRQPYSKQVKRPFTKALISPSSIGFMYSNKGTHFDLFVGHLQIVFSP